MEWQATDQFGNLYVGESSATSLDELRPQIASMISEVRLRAGESFRVCVDFDYKEIMAPDPENVTHVLRVPWLASQSPETFVGELATIVAEICAADGPSGVVVARA